jgi:AcrR family transcriptional regulator
MPGPVKRRSYNSTLRAEQARSTRARIVDAARALFTELGYPGTTLDRVGREAGVATDTVLHVFGSKKALLRAVLDVAIGGDDAPVPILDREGPQAMRREGDQRRQVAMFAAGMTAQLERLRPLDDILRSAAAVDADARALRDDLQLRQRREAMRLVAGWIAANGQLRAQMSVDEAAAIIWTLTSPEVHQMLREHCGWDAAHYESWLRDTLDQSLISPTPAPHGQ